MIPSRATLLVLALVCSSVPAIAQTQPSNADWPKASAAESGLSEAKLRSMDAAIRSEEFKKIGSVLIARHGKLAYEGYFDGDATTLRDTRSATKSITDVLVGIAIGEGKLSGVDARVLSLLPERARKIQNPDPRKASITVEDFLTMSSSLECDDWNGITAVSATDIWAFGSFFPPDGSGQQFTLLLHWDGTSWTIQPSPNPGDPNFRANILFGGTVIPQGEIWIVGNKFGNTLAIHATGQ